jgi:predicted phosphodiesterase
MKIIHLSDLHFENNDRAEDVLSKLKRHLKKLKWECPDCLLISGDIIFRGNVAGYEGAKTLIKGILDTYKGSRAIIVPGNHDVDLNQSEEAYETKSEKWFEGNKHHTSKDYLVTNEKGYVNFVRTEKEEEYWARFKNFANFYQEITSEEYPLNPEEQGLLYPFETHNVVICGLNSAWCIDHLNLKRTRLNERAVNKVIDKVDAGDYSGWLRLAVWHHPVNIQGEVCLSDSDGIINCLREANFLAAFHGHIHKPDSRQPQTLHQGNDFHCIGAGTFNAPEEEWSKGASLGYNLITIEQHIITVKSYKSDGKAMPWEDNYCWKGKNGESKSNEYTVNIPTSTPASGKSMTNKKITGNQPNRLQSNNRSLIEAVPSLSTNEEITTKDSTKRPVQPSGGKTEISESGNNPDNIEGFVHQTSPHSELSDADTSPAPSFISTTSLYHLWKIALRGDLEEDSISASAEDFLEELIKRDERLERSQLTELQMEVWKSYSSQPENFDLQAFHSERNVIISAPTSSGKSTVAEMFLLSCYFRNQQRRCAIYIAPTRALTQAKYEDLKSLFEGDREMENSIVLSR